MLLPFLMWPGGTRWFVSSFAELLLQEYGINIEPILGPGAAYFHFGLAKALLGNVKAGASIFTLKQIQQLLV